MIMISRKDRRLALLYPAIGKESINAAPTELFQYLQSALAEWKQLTALISDIHF